MKSRESTNSLVERIKQLERAARALDPGATRRKRLRNEVFASSERFLRQVASIKTYNQTDDKGIGLLNQPISQHGVSIRDVIEIFEHEVIRTGANPGTGGYLAYIPGGGIYHSALADFLAAVSNKYAGIFFAGAGAVRMENMLLRWVADLVGYPAEAGGNIASGGSIATLIAITTARDARRLRSVDYSSAVVYMTAQAHHSIEKSLRIAGMGEAKVRHVSMDERFRMRPDLLERMIIGDRGQGLTPWMIIAAAGTTDTGAIDPLEPIATIAEQEQCWFHVDAAYGGFFMLAEYGRNAMRGIERSNSVILDPHKSLFLPYGAGIVLVRDARQLTAAHRYVGSYMQDVIDEPGEISPADVSPELTKPFRALRMWLPLILLGTRPFEAALEEKRLLAQYFRQEIEAIGFEVGPPPDLSIVTFRWAPNGLSLERVNQMNQEIVEGIRKDGRVFLSSTMLDGQFTLRLAVLAFRTHRRTIDLAIRILRQQVSQFDDGKGSREDAETRRHGEGGRLTQRREDAKDS